MNAESPLEIDRSAGSEVRIHWSGGDRTVVSARRLRLLCPCAGCVDEVTGRRRLDPDRVPADVTVESARLVGRYAVEFSFSDGHSLGIYTFRTLREICG